MLSALADYGHYIQLFLADNKDWKIGTDHAAIPAVNELTEENVAEAVKGTANYAIKRDIGEAQIEKLTFSLTLDSDTAINLYLKGKSNYKGAITAEVNGDTSNAAIKRKDGRYRVSISNLPAYQLGETSHVVVNAGKSMDVQVSALSYVHAILNSSTYSENTNARYAMTALYRYYEAAQAYIH